MTSRRLQDRWFVTDSATGGRVPSARHGQGVRYRARYEAAAGKGITCAFADEEKSRVQRWLDEVRMGRRRCCAGSSWGLVGDRAG